MNATDKNEEPDGANSFLWAIGGTVLLGLGAVGLSILLDTPLPPQIKWSIGGVLVGIVATAPLYIFLRWFMVTTMPRFAEFRKSQIEFFSEIGFEFTNPRIIAMAIAAGVCEELLFRGVLQTWVAGFAPVIAAVIVTNVIFGLLHMRTVLYALIAGLVGGYLAMLFIVTDNLLAPIVTHAAYDFIALLYTRRAIDDFRSQQSAS